PLATRGRLSRIHAATFRAMRSIFALLAAAVVTAAAPALAGGNPETIEIPESGGLKLKAVLFRPDGSGPFPAIVGLHNCTGLNNRAGVMGERYRDWSQRLVKDGYAVLLPDSN